jgi:hypothetical protein
MGNPRDDFGREIRGVALGLKKSCRAAAIQKSTSCGSLQTVANTATA